MNRFVTHDLHFDGLKAVKRQVMGDSRGFLARIFCNTELASVGWTGPIAQINHTYTSKKGTVRGMHYQKSPYTEMKLVNCIRGEILDVVIDLRAGSKTFLQHYVALLSANNGQALLIPEGFAHGFQSLTDDVELIYCHSNCYDAMSEAGISPTDKSLRIKWPLPIVEISERDKLHPVIDQSFEGLVIQ
jgi:dTDP-4-dehydrorhamnose 3,5-epimerase